MVKNWPNCSQINISGSIRATVQNWAWRRLKRVQIVKNCKIVHKSISPDLSELQLSFWVYTHIFDPTELEINTFKQKNISGVPKLGQWGQKKVNMLPKQAKSFKIRYLWTYQRYSPHFGFCAPIFDPTDLKNNTSKQLNLLGL